MTKQAKRTVRLFLTISMLRMSVSERERECGIVGRIASHLKAYPILVFPVAPKELIGLKLVYNASVLSRYIT
uniref:Uncharacterized protein n=1 Tax=Physcomitrium patens TaxID=3218 RepID=A0A2K1KVW1_PHYPA|nr:hypothetical protein PHYPA_004907 [Physcomitrium patens]